MLLLICGCSFKSDIVNYFGDGKIQDISFTFAKCIPVKGYEIKFTNFDLGTDFYKEYTLNNLPALHKERAIIYLVTGGNYNSILSNSEIEISITDKLDKQVFHFKSMLNKMIKMNVTHLYDSNLDNDFYPKKSAEPYKLKVKYKGKKSLEGKTGYLLIRCGGSI